MNNVKRSICLINIQIQQQLVKYHLIYNTTTVSQPYKEGMSPISNTSSLETTGYGPPGYLEPSDYGAPGYLEPSDYGAPGYQEPSGHGPPGVSRQPNQYSYQHLEQQCLVFKNLQELLLEEEQLWEQEAEKRSSRDKRQVMTPDLYALQNGYSNFFMPHNRRRGNNKRKNNRRKESTPHNDMPIVLVPEEDETECVASNQLSTFGFLGFVLNVINAVMNVANNINNNLASNNNNDNNNNQNDGNFNQVGVTGTAGTMNPPVMTLIGRRLERLRMMRQEMTHHIDRLQKHSQRRKRDLAEQEGCDDGDAVDEAVMVGIALMDLWREVLVEDDPKCMAQAFCDTTSELTRFSRLGGLMADVSARAAANMLVEHQGVDPEYLIFASEQGADGKNCTELFFCQQEYDESYTSDTEKIRQKYEEVLKGLHGMSNDGPSDIFNVLTPEEIIDQLTNLDYKSISY